ncbi:hypothetical protein BDR07DRAFT_1444192, partial [Suillus spraguei]
MPGGSSHFNTWGLDGVLASDYFNDTPYVLLALPNLYHKHIQHTLDMLLQELMAFHHTQVPQSLTLAQIVAGAAPSHLLMSNSTYNNSIYSSRTLIIQHII